MARFYPLRKSRKILRSHYALFKRKSKRLTASDKAEIEADLRELDAALLTKDREHASIAAKKVQRHGKEGLRKSFWDVTRDLFVAIAFALVVAFFIRQFWFELYQVPTGSMRPTIEEQDRLLVSKTTFGVNFPFQNKLTFHNPDFVQRNGIIVLTTKNMDLADSNMLYFGIFPGKKRFVKRCVTKPGDTIYFYGGRIYGFDQEGKPFDEGYNEELLKKVGIEKIEHIPFISFQGKPMLKNRLSTGMYGQVTFKQMNLPLAKMQVQANGRVSGTFFNGEEWVKEDLNALKKAHDKPQSYSDLWGIGNFAMARLLTRDQVRDFYQKREHGDALLYLELQHTPNLTYPKPQVRQSDMGKYYPDFTPFYTLIPLQQRHLDAIQDALITARFYVKDGGAYRYVERGVRPQRREFDPKFPNVPNGLYEFYYGKGSKVYATGIQFPMSKKNPLYSHSPENVQKLFNTGFSLNLLYQPHMAEQPFVPQRYAYWRNGDLYIMGAPILKKGDAVLEKFVKDEVERQDQSSETSPYIAFVDHGPPLKADGSLDIDFVRAFGLKVPDNSVVALGDNYAGSADSRDFGFVPVHNLRGAPSFIFWPPGKRLGPLPQPSYPWITLPNILTWSLAFIAFLLSYLWIKKRNNRSIFK
ncbi:MAG: signal peptidase I [Chlamydiales bacterium]|nr:signal peptidase I [Chlamydiales bacterium]